MKLQSDPTIIYGLVGGKGTLGRPILRSEIEQPTPYNTYVIDGLPPGPIANPGRASLEAAANPARTKELYLRRRRHRRPRLRRELRAAPEERGAPARDRAAGQRSRRRQRAGRSAASAHAQPATGADASAISAALVTATPRR